MRVVLDTNILVSALLIQNGTLSRCLSQGKTCEEALSNIKEAIEGWLEVMQ